MQRSKDKILDNSNCLAPRNLEEEFELIMSFIHGPKKAVITINNILEDLKCEGLEWRRLRFKRDLSRILMRNIEKEKGHLIPILKERSIQVTHILKNFMNPKVDYGV